MSDIQLSKIKDAPKGSVKQGLNASKQSQKIRKRLSKMKVGQCFEMIGIDSSKTASVERSRVYNMSRNLKGKFATSLTDDILTVIKVAKSK